MDEIFAQVYGPRSRKSDVSGQRVDAVRNSRIAEHAPASPSELLASDH